VRPIFRRVFVNRRLTGKEEMSSQTLPESNAADRGLETAPSHVAVDEPRWARTIGLMGMMLSVLGLTVVVFNEIYGPRIISQGWGFVILAIGVVSMLFHAVRDSDIQIRRAYGVIGFALIGLEVILTLIRQGNFLAYGWACALAGLCFLLCFSKHETDPAWRKRIMATIGGIGALMTAIGFLGGIVADNFLVTYGLLLAMLGLIYLCAFISQSDPLTNIGFRTGLAIGAIGAFAFLYAVFRSAAPSVVKMQLSPFLVPNGLLLMFLGAVYGSVSLAIVSDNKLVVQTRRELTSYFYSPVAYIVMLAMAVLGGLAYYFFINILHRGIVYEPIVLHYFSMFPPVVVMFVVPAITMRLMSEEKRTGSYEVLMCAPVRESTVVLSKFFACLIFFMLLWSLWALYLIGLRSEGGANEFDYRPLLSFYLALAVSGAGFVSMGLFFSSLSKNQVIAAVLTFIGMLLLFFVGRLQNFEGAAPLWRNVYKHISYGDLWNASLHGRMQVRELILQGSFAVFWLFLTIRVLESRRWT
jgi:ABC-2 type transport system permease protein